METADDNRISSGKFRHFFSIEKDDELKREIVLIRFAALHKGIHYITPTEKALAVFKNKPVMVEEINNTGIKIHHPSLVEYREKLLYIDQANEKAKRSFLRESFDRAIGSWPEFLDGRCEVLWFYNKCPKAYKKYILEILEEKNWLGDYEECLQTESVLIMCDNIGLREYVKSIKESLDPDIIEIAEEYCEEMWRFTKRNERQEKCYQITHEQYRTFCKKYLLLKNQIPFKTKNADYLL